MPITVALEQIEKAIGKINRIKNADSTQSPYGIVAGPGELIAPDTGGRTDEN
jgi:hypothetical protein